MRLTAFLAMAALLASSAPAAAQTPESVQISATLTHEIFELIDFKGEVRKGAAANLAASNVFGKIRPEWPKLLIDSLDEEIDHDAPAMEGVIARTLAQNFTLGELRAGQTVMRDPAMRALLAAYGHHQPDPKPANPPCAPECMTTLASPDGLSFMQKFGAIDKLLGPDAQNELMAILLPGTFRRFGEKAEALEKSRSVR